MARDTYVATAKSVNFDVTSLFDQYGQTGLFCLSGSTWQLAYRLVQHYGYWRSRYFYTDPVTGQAMTLEDTEYEEITNLVDQAQEELQMGCFDEFIAAIDRLTAATESNGAIAMASDCGCNVGEGPDNGEGTRGGAVPDPVGGVVYDEPAVVTDRDCKAANLVYETIYSPVNYLRSYPIDDFELWSVPGVLALLATVISIVVAAPMAVVVGAAAGTLVLLAAALIAGDLDLDVVSVTMSAKRDDLVCALYQSSNTTEAREQFLNILEVEGLSDSELAFVGIWMTNAVMNVLYFDTDQTAAFWDGYTASTDCSLCGLGPCNWVFLDAGSGPRGTGDLTDDGTQRTLTSVNHGGVDRIHIEVDAPAGCDELNKLYVIKSSSQPTGWPTAQGFCAQEGGTLALQWDNSNDGGPNPEIDVEWSGHRILLSRTDGEFTLDIVLMGGEEPPCL